MPAPISSVALAEKNAISSDGVFLVTLDITIPGTTEIVRLVDNTEDITWAGNLYQRFPFQLEDISSGERGEVPQVTLRVGNTSRVMGSYIREYDVYCKNHGYTPIPMRICVVNTKDLANPSPVVEHEYLLKQPKCDAMWATFILSANNPYRRRCPQARILRNFCRFRFKDRRCQYSGSQTACNKTLPRCRDLGNSVNFGGFPAAGQGGFDVAS